MSMLARDLNLAGTEAVPGGGTEPEGTVSVIISTRGRPELVRATLASVIGQDYTGPLQVIVVHDQEPCDGSLAELSRHQRTVFVTTNKRAPGLAGSRNTGIGLVRGEFVATCDDDDIWHPSKVSEQVRLMRRDPTLLMVGTGIRLMFPKGRTVELTGRSHEIEMSVLVRTRVQELHSSTLLVRREVYDKVGLYDEELPYGYAEDYDFALRVARVGRVRLVRRALADIRKNGTSWFLENQRNNIEALQYLLIKHPEFAASRRGYSRMLGQIAFAQNAIGQRSEARRSVTAALRQWPTSPHALIVLAQLALGVDSRCILAAVRLRGRGIS